MTLHHHDIRPVAAAPHIHMPHGKAWRLDLDAFCRSRKLPREAEASIDAWLIEAPWAHPAWHSYVLSLIHLRPIADAPPPVIYRANATHELVLLALDPAGDRDRLLTENAGEHCRALSPPNFAAQIVEVSDDLARNRVRAAVEMICAGQLSPDTDHIRQWIKLFGDSMVRKHA